MKLTFRLKPQNKNKKSSIYLDINHANQRLKYGTGLSIHPDLWNQEKQRAKPSKKMLEKHKKETVGIESILQNLNTELEDILRAAQKYQTGAQLNNDSISAKGLREFLKATFKMDAKLNTLFVMDYFEDHYLPGIEDGTIKHSKHGQMNRYSPNTVKTKRQTLNAFIKYEEKTSTRIRFDDIDMSFYKKFVSYCRDEDEKKNYDTNYSTNYIGRLIRDLKAVLSQAYEEGLHNNKLYKNRGFTTLRQKVKSVYLTQDELDALEALPLEGMDKMYRAAFLIGCYTALRFSDFSQLDKSHITSCGRFIRKHTQKTGTEVVIPLHPFVKQTLNDKEYQNKGILYPQKLNKKIKKFAKDAGITQEVEIKTNEKGKTVYKKIPKYKKITSHTARRSGATLLYLAGVPSIDIMKITGHTTEKHLLNYICVTPEETAQRLANSTFFNPSPLKAVK